MIELRCRKCGTLGRVVKTYAETNYCPKCGRWLTQRYVE